MLHKILTLLVALTCAAAAQAQFFDFGFDDSFPFSQRRVQQRERTTPPQFKGGQAKLQATLEKQFRNPDAVDRNLDAVIVVACLVTEKGKVAEVHVVRSAGRALDDEALRVCRKLKFQPALRGKEKVKGRFDVRFPIRRGRLSFSTLPTVEV